MNPLKIDYGITTVLVVAGMLLDVYSSFFYSPLKAAFVHLGFAGWVRIELINAKLVGAQC
jgi:hypothetical protein